MTFLLDDREGSYLLARHEPLRSLLAPCPSCNGTGYHPDASPKNPAPCRSTGRQLARIKTSAGEGGPDALIVGQGPSGPLLVGVEVKTVRELLQAADTGRLQAHGEGQLQTMLAEYEQCYLLIYGAVRAGSTGDLEEPRGKDPHGRTMWRPLTKNGDSAGRPIKAAQLEAMLIEIEVMGVHTKQVRSIEEAARWLGVLHGWWTKPWTDHKFTHTFDTSRRIPLGLTGYSTAELTRARFAKELSGVGVERALAAGKHFGSVREMANADVKEWAEVAGIGKVIAKSIVKEFNS